MKNRILPQVASVLAALSLLCACGNDYDDTALKDRLDNLDGRVIRLEKLCWEMNSNIDALKTIVDALQGKDVLEDVSPLIDGSGYVLKFTSGKTVKIYNGKDGHSPEVSVRQDEDGIWYWTLDGEWLLGDGGEKMQASAKDGVTPQVKISDGYWYVSTDGGQSWSQMGKVTGEDGKDGYSFFKGVSVNAETVRFELNDGTAITLPLSSATKFNIVFDYDSVPVLDAGETKTVNYSITRATDKTVVKTIAQNGWTATVNQKSKDSGEIIVQAPNPIVHSEILVFASDGEGQTVMAVLDCVQGQLSVARTNYSVNASGGEVDLVVTANMPYNVVISDEAQSWLSLKESTKASVTEIKTLVVQANTDYQKRFATVRLTDTDGNTLQTVEILQEAAAFTGDLSITVTAKGTLSSALSSYSYTLIKSLSITGPLNDDDYTFIKDELVSLRKLDLSGATGAEPIFKNHQYTLDLVILPSCLTVISESAFEGSYVVQIVLPENLQSIGDKAFYKCSRMTGAISIPRTVTYIGKLAFAGTPAESFLLADGIQLTKFEDNCLPPKISALRIPASVLALTYSAFSNLVSLESLTFEEGTTITEIPSFCFANLPLTNVVLPKTLKKIGGQATATSSTTTCRGKSTYGGAFEGCTSLQSITIPKEVEAIEAGAFHSSGLKSVTFEEGCKIEKLCGWSYSSKRIGTFSATQLETVTIPENVTEIQNAAFADCSKLRSVDFSKSKSLKVIGGVSSSSTSSSGGAFWCCTALQRLYIPSSVEDIQAGAFHGCSGLVSIEFAQDSHLSEISGFDHIGPFSDCTGITTFTVPASVQTIGTAAFGGCTSLAGLYFESGSKCETICGGSSSSNTYAPFTRTQIRKLVLPASMKTISSHALSGMGCLETIQLEAGANVEFSYYACYGSYYNNVYYRTSNLSEIDASEASFSVTSRSFMCYSISGYNSYADYYCPISIVKIGSIRPPVCSTSAFGDVSNAKLYVPEDSIEEYKQTAGWKDFGSILPL